MTGLIAKKLGMTQKFAEDGSVIPLTVLKAGPCIVVQRKTVERDGYDAVQLGLVEAGRKVTANKPIEGHFKKAGAAPCRILREFPIARDDDTKVGDAIKVSVFEVADTVHVRGVSKGKGFAGVMKRHGFHGQRASHGSKVHRAPGSIGQSASPSRVFPGMKGPGRMGQDRVTVKNLKVVEVIEDEDLLLVRGPVPGATGTYVEIVKKESARKKNA
jgi:large subunit ribosomal protein L3